MKYVFLGSPEIAVVILRRLCEEFAAPELVITQTAKAAGRGQKIASTAVAQFAREKNFKVIETDNINGPECVQALKAVAPQVIFTVAFGQILKQEVLSLPSVACLNVHASLLPKYRGAAPVQRAIWNHETVTGVTIQKMVKKLDAGDILLQREINILPEETSGELLLRLGELGAAASVESLRMLQSGSFRFVPQNESLATVAPKIDKSDATIDWNLPALKIYDQIRALQPWPVAETLLDGQALRVFRAEVGVPYQTLSPGEIHTDHKSHLWVGCGDKLALSLTEIQAANRKRLIIRDFLLAYRGNFPHKKMGTHAGQG